MKRRDFLKVSLTAGVATALPINVFGHTDNSDNDAHQNGDKPDLSGAADILILGNIITVDENKLFADAMTIMRF
ncbi:MAG: twin-arginine translocation signal domain-containing protein [Muribaculaceae bacterium]|nr:twin-arginine translocation signal domain-containing protein [Muribaculaceae bacterium]